MAALELGPEDVDVWRLPPTVPAATLDWLESLISPQERARADRFVFADHRRRFVAAHGWLRAVLAAYLDQPPAELEIAGAPGTKPRLAGGAGPCFSLSHSGDLALVAVAADCEVGVDVEVVRPLPDFEALARAILSQRELRDWQAVPEPDRLRVFFEAWTRKEAFLKAVGEGLSRELQSFDVSLSPGTSARLLRVEGDSGAPQRYEMHALELGADCVAALVVERRGVRVRVRSPEISGRAGYRFGPLHDDVRVRSAESE